MTDQNQAAITLSTQAPYADSNDIINFINGQATASSGSRKQDVFNPSTGKAARQVVLSTLDDLNKAVAAAKAAAPAWADTPPVKRARIMNKFQGLMNQHTEDRKSTRLNSRQ